MTKCLYILFLGLLLTANVCLAGLTEHRVTPTGKPADTPALQAAIDLAGKDKLPVVLEPGAFVVNATIIIPGDVDLRSASGAKATMLLATAPVPILRIVGTSGADEGTISDLSFGATVKGATGITGHLAVAQILDCTFRNELSRGIHASAILSNIEDNDFGTAGDRTTDFIAMRITGDGGSNANTIQGNRFYNSAGTEPAVWVSGGNILTFDNNNVELNRTTSLAPVRFEGLDVVTFKGNWFENNTGAYQVEVKKDATRNVRCVVVSNGGNRWELSAPGNVGAVSLGAAAAFIECAESGNLYSKPLSNVMSNVRTIAQRYLANVSE